MYEDTFEILVIPALIGCGIALVVAVAIAIQVWRKRQRARKALEEPEDMSASETE